MTQCDVSLLDSDCKRPRESLLEYRPHRTRARKQTDTHQAFGKQSSDPAPSVTAPFPVMPVESASQGVNVTHAPSHSAQQSTMSGQCGFPDSWDGADGCQISEETDRALDVLRGWYRARYTAVFGWRWPKTTGALSPAGALDFCHETDRSRWTNLKSYTTSLPRSARRPGRK